jgi:hypothetical protein
MPLTPKTTVAVLREVGPENGWGFSHRCQCGSLFNAYLSNRIDCKCGRVYESLKVFVLTRGPKRVKRKKKKV